MNSKKKKKQKKKSAHLKSHIARERIQLCIHKHTNNISMHFVALHLQFLQCCYNFVSPFIIIFHSDVWRGMCLSKYIIVIDVNTVTNKMTMNRVKRNENNNNLASKRASTKKRNEKSQRVQNRRQKNSGENVTLLFIIIGFLFSILFVSLHFPLCFGRCTVQILFVWYRNTIESRHLFILTYFNLIQIR